jgi:hypothetical protein
MLLQGDTTIIASARSIEAPMNDMTSIPQRQLSSCSDKAHDQALELHCSATPGGRLLLGTPKHHIKMFLAVVW